jgi:hypothetical protein
MTPQFFIIWCSGAAGYLIIALIMYLRGRVERDILPLVVLSAFSSWLGLGLLGIAALRDTILTKKREKERRKRMLERFKK